MTEQLITDMEPTAASLVCAVADDDREQVAEILTTLDTTRLHAIAVILAASVDLDSPLLRQLVPMSRAAIVEHITTTAADMFDTTVERILSASRRREVIDARHVAMYACRLAGMSTPAIGDALNRDHSTVLHGCGRVGEQPRLRQVASLLASQVGPRLGILGDEMEGAA